MAKYRDGNDTHDDEDNDFKQLLALMRGEAPPHVPHPGYSRPIARISRAGDPQGGWGECDASLLDDSRPPVPPFPLEVLPTAWRTWVHDRACAAGAPVDYVAMSLIAAVGGLCGAGIHVQAAPGWIEPLVLWQALVGAPSSGKSPAIAPLRALIETLAQNGRGEQEPGSAHTETYARGLGDMVAADAKGGLLWCDEPADWLSRLANASASGRAQLLRAWSGAGGKPVFGLLACLQAETVPVMAKNGAELAARFLFAWPHPAPYSPLAGRKHADDDSAIAALRRLLEVAGAADAPTILPIEEDALPALDSFLAQLHLDIADAEGLDQAWQGKGRGTLVRLIGCLALLDWSSGSTASPGPIARQSVEQGIMLWRTYLRPHARAVLELAIPNDVDRKARQVVRWLRSRQGGHVSREEIRCEALGRSVNAAGAERVLQRLQSAGIVKQLLYAVPPNGGRPPNRWAVNPAMTAGNAGNSGNLPDQV